MHRRRNVRSAAGRALVVGVCLAAVGCATRGDVQDARLALAEEIEDVRATQDSLRSELSAVGTQLDRMESRQKDLILGRSSELQRQIEQLRGQISRLTALVGQTRQRLEANLARRPPPRDTGAAADTTGTAAGGSGASADEPEALYQAALEQFRRQAYETAGGALQEFVSRYPEHRLAPDARYYLGRSMEETGRGDRALEAYRRVVELHPNSNRAPSALYRLGLAHLDRGETEEARQLFQQIVRGYPDSPEATPATRQLEKIGGG